MIRGTVTRSSSSIISSLSILNSNEEKMEDDVFVKSENTLIVIAEKSPRPKLRKTKSDVSSRMRRKFYRSRSTLGSDVSDVSLCEMKAINKSDSDNAFDRNKITRKLSTTLLSVPSLSSLLETVKQSPMLNRRRSRNQLKERRASSLAKLEINDLHTQVKRYEIGLHNFKMISRKELIRVYSQLKVPFPARWLTEGREKVHIEDIFVEPDMSFNRNPVRLSEIFLVQPNRVNENPVIVIKGEAGTGKTALCQYLTYSWSHRSWEIHMLDTFDLLFMIEFKFIENDDLSSMIRSHYLKETVKELEKNSLQDDYLFSMINDSNTLFILDGFDESDEKCIEKLRTIRICFSNAKIVVTTRHCAIRDMLNGLNLDINCDVVELLLNTFNDIRKVHLIVNISELFGKTDQEQFILLDEIEEGFYNFEDVLNIPLHIILYFIIWFNDEKAIRGIITVNDLYCRIVKLMKTQLYKYLNMERFINRNTANDKIDKLVLEVGKVSLKCVQDRQFYFTPYEYNLIKTSPVNVNCYITCNTIMQKVEHLVSRNLRILFHTSLMEYMAAIYVDHTISTTDLTMNNIVLRRKASNVDRTWTGCMNFTMNSHKYATNIEEKNHQLDNLIMFLMTVSVAKTHSVESTGFQVVRYFPLSYNRNLPTLASIVKTAEADDLFMKGARRSLAKQHLPALINHWNIKHLITLLDTKAVKPTVHIKFSVENKTEWGETVNELVKYGCKPFVKVVIEQPEQMQALLRALQVIEQPSVPKLILHFGYIEIGLSELVERWPYPKPLLIMSSKKKYSIESYLTCLTLVNLIGEDKIKHVIFSGDESSYILGMLKKSLPGLNIHLIPNDKTAEYVVINTKRNKNI